MLNGSKRWIGNATFADVVVIWARDVADEQVKGFIVETATAPGFTATKIERKQSLRVVQNADITLVDVRVPEERRLQLGNGFRDTAKVLALTRAEVAWQAVGNAVGAYEAAVRYVAEREQFGRKLGSFQLIQDLLSKSLGNITASIAMCTRLSQMMDEGRPYDQQAALAKAFVTARGREVVGWCREALGGNGIQLDQGVARRFADAEALYTYEGTYQMNNLIVGRSITGPQRLRLNIFREPHSSRTEKPCPTPSSSPSPARPSAAPSRGRSARCAPTTSPPSPCRPRSTRCPSSTRPPSTTCCSAAACRAASRA